MKRLSVVLVTSMILFSAIHAHARACNVEQIENLLTGYQQTASGEQLQSVDLAISILTNPAADQFKTCQETPSIEGSFYTVITERHTIHLQIVGNRVSDLRVDSKI